ncbi:MAG: PilZ domain-containing protein [Spirochaetes bacterium]|nr:PilZ domain-containing protein [Spirochaetota bacterium]
MEGATFLRDTRYPIPPDAQVSGGVRLLGTSSRVAVERLVDLSAAGLRFVCKSPFQEKTDVDVLLHIGSYKLKFIGQVLRITEADGGRWDIFVSFQTISEVNLRKLFSLVKT